MFLINITNSLFFSQISLQIKANNKNPCENKINHINRNEHKPPLDATVSKNGR